MDSLCYQLIFHAKAERWFQLLEIMEENEHILAQHLIDQTQAARRTVLDDIKEIKIYFGDTLQLSGEESASDNSFIIFILRCHYNPRYCPQIFKLSATPCHKRPHKVFSNPNTSWVVDLV
ncbi:hypothetical protein [Enterococcus innesii]|uniref:hypothetical protein n=1 Tax=Enterococcus innesii TaxID=2839759 RepID=UPI002DBB0ED5|nr:hypothetical protein [Enterococcus innesii]MEB5953109.1 hypothetical protein [Enterococcus innesii]